MTTSLEHQVQWLGLAYGDEEATKIMALPEDTRFELYSDVLCYGPAGETVVSVVRDLKETALALPPGWNIYRKAILPVALGVYAGTVKNWAYDNNLRSLAARLRKLCSQNLVSENVTSAEALLWALNGQYLFPANNSELMNPCFAEMSALLKYLGRAGLSSSSAEERLS